MRIKEASARKIFDSRGQEAVEVQIKSEEVIARGSCDSGTSIGKYEVKSYPQKGVNEIITLFNKRISKELENFQVEKFSDLERVESLFKIFDITSNLENTGGNIIISTEYAILKAVSKNEVWRFLNPQAKKIPGILANVIGGGRHSSNKGADFQEFLVIPKVKDMAKAVRISVQIYNEAKSQLYKRDKEFSEGRNIEGALCTNLTNLEILDMLNKICNNIGKRNKTQIGLGLDVAGNSFWNGRKYEYKRFSKSESKRNLSREEQIEYLKKLIKSYNLDYVEDPLQEDDFEGFRELNRGYGIISGDDLIATNLERLKNAVKKISAVIIKPNQIGSLVKTKEVIDFAFKNKIMPIISHRSGATNDVMIAHLAVGWELPLIKTGLMGGERINRLNELIRIQEKL